MWDHKSRKWAPGKLEEHGAVNISIKVCKDAYQQLKLPKPDSRERFDGNGILNTGAQMCVGGEFVINELSVNKSELIKPELSINAANSTKIEIIGAIFVEVFATNKRSNE